MDSQIIAQRATGREALARILAAIDDGAPEPTAITGIGLNAGAVISYHQRPDRDSHAEAAAMVRALDIAAEPHTAQRRGYHSITWETWDFTTELFTHWQVTAFVDGQSPAVQS